ncbi:MAG: thioredoxin family protein, partial [Kiritimatiellae bacterium]|nr:thioredoxin family protein [Kiritimatiellia bacterium]
ALAYGGTGLLVVLTGATFGGLNANAWFNGVIALLFLVLALGMFDVIHIDLARFQRSGPSVRRGGLLVALSMGMVSALLAGACVAPVVISVLIWSGQLVAEGHYSGLLLPFVLGAGMALPWPFAGAGLSLLPRPGGWMIWVRNGFGVLILLLALYYGYQAYNLSGLRFAKDGEDAGHEMLTPEQVNQRLAVQLRAAAERGRPVLLDFGASWCKNCKTMERTTLRDPEVIQALDAYHLIYYAAENPDLPETKAVLNHFDVLGLPTYLLLELRENGVR